MSGAVPSSPRVYRAARCSAIRQAARMNWRNAFEPAGRAGGRPSEAMTATSAITARALHRRGNSRSPERSLGDEDGKGLDRARRDAPFYGGAPDESVMAYARAATSRPASTAGPCAPPSVDRRRRVRAREHAQHVGNSAMRAPPRALRSFCSRHRPERRRGRSAWARVPADRTTRASPRCRRGSHGPSMRHSRGVRPRGHQVRRRPGARRSPTPVRRCRWRRCALSAEALRAAGDAISSA